MQDINKNKLIKILGEVVKSHRLSKNKSIYRISAESSLSKSAWREVEIGACKDINLSTLWKISEGLEIPITGLLDEVKENLGNKFTLID